MSWRCFNSWESMVWTSTQIWTQMDVLLLLLRLHWTGPLLFSFWLTVGQTFWMKACQSLGHQYQQTWLWLLGTVTQQPTNTEIMTDSSSPKAAVNTFPHCCVPPCWRDMLLWTSCLQLELTASRRLLDPSGGQLTLVLVLCVMFASVLCILQRIMETLNCCGSSWMCADCNVSKSTVTPARPSLHPLLQRRTSHPSG